jgi:type IV secretory pathway TraG/TraD family ATPase VirD4
MAYKLDLGRIKPKTLGAGLARIYDLKTRYRHAYIIGKTGTGKSTLMLNMALYDIEYGCACIFIDPKGDVVQKLNSLITDKSRIINFSITNPLTINPLQREGYHRNDLIKEFIDVLALLVNLTVDNPIAITLLMNEIITEALLLFKKKQMNIEKLYYFLISYPHRKEFFEVHKPRPQYWKLFDSKIGIKKRESAERVASRLHPFITDPRVKKIVNGKDQFSVKDLVRERKVFLVDTSKMSDDTRIYVSSLITHAVKSYCQYETQVEYDPLMVYVDEFQTCFSSYFGDLLAASRSYKVGFVLAHQNLSQVKIKGLLDTLFGVVDTYVAFRPGDLDAKRLASLYGLRARDFLDLKRYEAYVRLGNKNILVATHRPPEIPHPEFNFLRDDWIMVK